MLPFSTYIFSADISLEMLRLGRVTKFKMLFLVLVFVFNFAFFKFSAAILEKGPLCAREWFVALHFVIYSKEVLLKKIITWRIARFKAQQVIFGGSAGKGFYIISEWWQQWTRS